ncbi:DUF3313 domain-containing protein [Sphingomonas sp. RB56-2]|uniref:DUF3313 domain-containing protein n=1 Tax=Sphingomonas brevis TaxID=2908206 RepID=A0ABT0SB52_9SPHN|nr:DUF3313 domain-containing protein [Sphingomonas brevis]MCL6741306.1 DUF3313 domain-containing protein [Sphingomonas brevis]
MSVSLLRAFALSAVAMTIAVPAQAQTKEQAPVSLSSARKMMQDKPGTESWTYAQPQAAFLKYRTVIVDPTVVYSGPDAQFDDIDAADRSKYAAMITDELRSELAKTFPVPAKPQADTLRIKVTILGAKKTKGGVATATRVTPVGFATSALKSALGKKGTFTGSVLYAVEAFDGQTNELMLAAVRRRTPDPLDVPATLSTGDTVKSVARDFASSARKRLEELTQVGGN